ncbi:SxtJ family membrane protein [Taklimakanibacter deserti]|uniref:SxtJ family membrane protein n=1 Tax=Taklimakanibacter deserti TaxID=2267839 RepID=UPI000E65E9FF
MSASHERIPTEDDARAGSDRSFGIVFAVVFALIGLFPLTHGGDIRLWALAGTLVFGGLAFLWPSLLAPLNRLWFRFGMLLHKIVNPLVLGLMFFVIITPVAAIVRLFGGKLLSLGFDKEARSYWHRRTPPGPAPETIRNQF